MERVIARSFRKLKGRSLDEYRVRGTQAVSAFSERCGWPNLVSVAGRSALPKIIDRAQIGGSSATADRLLDHFRSRLSPLFFPAFAEQDVTIAELRRHFPPVVTEAVVRRACAIMEGRFDLLGFHDLSFGEPIDWHLEPIAGKCIPIVHWSRTHGLDTGVVGDRKVVWELNRHQYLSVLGRAYWLTQDERFAQAFVSHVDAWMGSNPPKQGINWASSLEVALRAISWIWALYFFRNSPQLTPSFFVRMLGFLFLHGRHVETYLSSYCSPNTHLTGEALGLFYLGTIFPELRRAGRWRAIGKRILTRQLERQVLEDGTYFEQSTYYHRYTTDFYMHFFLLSQLNGQQIGTGLEGKLIALLDHLMNITRPDGTTAQIGDGDGGRLVWLEERVGSDFRSALTTGAVLFSRADYKYVAGRAGEETLWLLGSEGLRAFDRLDACPPRATSCGFKDSGYYVMRDGWTSGSNYLLVDCGPHGALKCAHAHADALAFDLAALGRTIVMDPGTYTYSSAGEMRDLDRSSLNHNTVSVDGQSSSVPAGAWAWQAVARSRARVWLARQRFDYFEGAHDGYMRLPSPVMHSRSILFLKGDYWIIRDRLIAEGTHSYGISFHFHPDASPSVEYDHEGTVLREYALDRPGIDIVSFTAGGAWRRHEGWVSSCYGERARAAVWTFTATKEGKQEFTTFLIPRQVSAPRVAVGELTSTRGRAFELREGERRDVCLAGDGRIMKAGRWDSDFEWTWVRFGADPSEPQEMVLLGGRSLLLEGREIIAGKERIGYMVVRWCGEELRIETDAKSDFGVASLGAADVLLNGSSVHRAAQPWVMCRTDLACE